MAALLSAKLDRTDSNTPWGFRLHGGKDFSAPLTIQRVTPGSLAAKCGLVVGDTILKIGETSTDTLRHKEAQSAVIASGNSLDLSIKRGGAPAAPAPQAADPYQPSTPSYGGYSNPAPQSYSTANSVPGVNYNVKPKPFMGGGGGGVANISTHTAQMNLGSGNEDTDTSSTHGSEDFPPPPPLPTQSPPPPSHATSTKHDINPPAFSATPWKSSAAAATALKPVPSTKPVALTPTQSAKPVALTSTQSAKPVALTPTQSAVMEEQDDGEEVPRYRGYTNPSIQSRTFKMLQQQINSGEGDVAR